MAKEVMERKASDNKYLHKDFHVSLDIGIDYIGKQFGPEAIDAYLTQYAKAFYQPMTLKELQRYFERIYQAEEAQDVLKTVCTDTFLTVEIRECPAIRFMKQSGHEPSEWYEKTTSVLYRVLAEICGLRFELEQYDRQTGQARFTFRRDEK